MSPEETAKLAELEALLLRHEAFIARVIQERRPPDKAESAKSKWLQFLQSTSGTALITVVIGGIFGAIISGVIQWGAKEREFQQSWLKARGDQAMVAYKDFVEKRAQVVENVYARLGSSVSASEDFIELSKDNYVVKPGLDEKTRNDIQAYRKKVGDSFDSEFAKWRNERETIGFLIDYYHPREADVTTSWNSLKESISTYFDCARKWHKYHRIDDDTTKACPDERQNLSINIQRFTTAIGSGRTYAWQGWESPDGLRRALEK